MRILQLRFKNLNSLVGEWFIDFSHENFVEDGIFAIVGPTGAGKTTVLDAMSLALYGRTPRLSNVTQSGNEIMSRKCGECFAELVFETQKGRFRCHWSQHRARRVPNGELQPPRQEIAELESGKVLESGLSKARQLSESITGMKFEQFTRAVLLAQGGFAAFLQASSVERAPLLEQITGTEIYSEISKQVHERHAFELRKKLELENRTSALQRVDPSRLAQIRDELEIAWKTGAELKETIKGNEAELQILKQILQLEANLAAHSVAEREQAQMRFRFSGNQERLERALLGLELSSDYQKLSLLREEYSQMLVKLEALESEFPAVERTCNETANLLQRATESQVLFQEHAQETERLIRKTRELDAFLAAKKQALAAQLVRVKEIGRQTEFTEVEKAQCVRELVDCQEAEQKVSQWEACNKVDALLTERLEALKLQLQSSKVLKKNIESLQHDLEVAKAAEQHTNVSVAAQRERLTQIAAQLQLATDRLGQKVNELRAELGISIRHFTPRENQEAHAAEARVFDSEFAEIDLKIEWELIENLRIALSESILLESRLEKVESAAKELEDTSERYVLLDLADKEHTERLSRLEHERHYRVELRDSLTQQKRLLESQLVLLRTMQNFEQVRTQLRDGEACPLCGALEHPFAHPRSQGNLPLPSTTEKEFQSLEEKCNLVDAELKAIDLEISVAQAMKTNRAAERNALSARIERGMHVIEEMAELLGPSWLEALQVESESPAEQAIKRVPQHFIERVRAARKKSSSQKEFSEKTLERVTLIEGEIRQLQAMNSALQGQWVAAKLDLNAAVHLAGTAKKQCEDLLKSQAAARNSSMSLFGDLQLVLKEFGFAPVTLEAASAALDDLCRRELKWKETRAEKLRLELSLLQLKTNLENFAAKLTHLQQSQEQESALLQKILREVEQTAALRKETFGEQNTDTEEQKLKDARADVELRLNEARAKHQAAIEKRGTAKSLIENLKESLPAAAAAHARQFESFSKSLFERGFTSEDDFLSACVSDAERAELNARSRELREKEVELVAKRADLEQNLAVLRLKRHNSVSQEQLQQETDEALLKLESVQQKIGACEQQVREHEGIAAEYQSLWQELQKQNTELAKWQSLQELIGSADGRKFRNFAQGITLQILVGQANRQLEKMNDRYFLVKNGEEGLELGVIDTYQAGEVRSVKNLSGGESFIVSLALALGLSAMASSKLRLDSLFLDEGFGTLDEEVLEVALDTLASLKDEGKLVGIISHVGALKQRISCQIQVQPLGSGRSVLIGPGVEAR